jgi:hypothetical protein
MKKILLFLLLFTAFSSFIKNSSGLADVLRSKLASYANENWPEKVFVHTDKPYYLINDDLWFSTYLVNGITHKESSKSAVVYVELIDEADSIVRSKRLYIDQLSAAGHFKIDTSWTPGRYLLRAYTNYMRNEQPQVFFQKELQVISLQDQKERIPGNIESTLNNTPLNVERPELFFYPEGGDLVEEMNSKVAFKIKNPVYHNSQIPIEIVDSDGMVLSRTTSTEFGLGFFHIRPQSGQKYFANLMMNGQVYQYPLPEVLTNGYALHINLKGEELLIGLNSSAASRLKDAFLRVHQRGKILFDHLEKTPKKSDIISIFTGNLPDGVAHITLFNAQGQPVCERLIYIDNEKNKAVAVIKKSKEVFESREKVTLNLQIQNPTGSKLSGNVSMSIRDLEAYPEQKNSENIKTWLLLNSDLRGYIESPGYFFSPGETSKKTFLLDLIMLTNGWRRFTWQSLLQDSGRTRKFEVERGITISGTTRMLEAPNKATTAINTITFFGRETLDMQSVNSKKDGSFEFGPYVFYDSIQTLIQSKLVDSSIKTANNFRDVLIKIDENTSSSPQIIRAAQNLHSNVALVPNDEFMEASGYIRDLNLQYDEERQLLDEIVLTATKKTKAEERQEEMEERSFYGGPSRRMDVESDPFLSKTELRFIFQRFPSVTLGNGILYYRGEPCRILFNDVAVDLNYVLSLNPSDISFIEFFDPTNSVFGRAPGGVFVIYGKLGIDQNTRDIRRKPGIINFMSKGFDSTKEFYAPDYSKDLDQMTRTDVRTTLHWDPMIRLSDQQPTREISFYTCDLNGTYQIEIQGVTDSGVPIHEISYFYVN